MSISGTIDSTVRFSSRVEYYLKYRPKYPKSLIDFLYNDSLISTDSIIADIGSGTGFFSEMLLQENNLVIGIEPNDDMRHAAEKHLIQHDNFISIKGSAENTTLQDNSVDHITIATAFHWFDIEQCKIEFKRILRNNGYIFIISNKRKKESTEFMQEYETLLKSLESDYTTVRNPTLDADRIDQFFGKNQYTFQSFPYEQNFNTFEELKGRLLSGSYTPLFGEKGYEEMQAELANIYNKHAVNGTVSFYYDTVLWFAKL